jgi:hypothetical protein
LETINLHITNAAKSDSAYYLCIVANSLKSFRVTYSYLKVIDKIIPTTKTDAPSTSVFADSKLNQNETASGILFFFG